MAEEKSRKNTSFNTLNPQMRGENRMTTATGDARAEGTGSEIRRCERLQRALGDCNRRMPPGPVSDAACHHLNRALAECLVSAACPDECQAVRSLCSSAGTALKRSQCQQAQLSLSVCLSSLQLSP